MPRYGVDVKAFLSVTVEAESPEAASDAASAFVEALEPSEAFVAGYSGTQRAEGRAAIVIKAGCFDIDGDSEIEDIVTEETPCPECGGLGAFPITGEDCGPCYGGGTVI